MSSIINLMSQGLDGSLKRQKALSNNIANVDTPNYKRKDIDFVSALRQESRQLNKSSIALKTTNDSHISIGKELNTRSTKSFLENSSYRNDKNNVDIDVEMAEVAKNGLYYNTLSKQINEQFKIMKNIISKGGSQ